MGLGSLWHKIHGNFSSINKSKKPQLTDFCLWNEAVVHYLDSGQELCSVQLVQVLFADKQICYQKNYRKELNRKPALEGSSDEQYTCNLKPSFVVQFQCGVIGLFLL